MAITTHTAANIVPGHDRDAMPVHMLTADDPWAYVDAPDVVGLDDAAIELDAIALDEWAAAQADDEYWPTLDDKLVAFEAAQG